MASKKSSKKNKLTKPEGKNPHLGGNNPYLVTVPRTRRIYRDVGPDIRNKNKPLSNAVWKEFQKLRKEKDARDKARSILKKNKKRAQAKFRKKQLLDN